MGDVRSFIVFFQAWSFQAWSFRPRCTMYTTILQHFPAIIFSNNILGIIHDTGTDAGIFHFVLPSVILASSHVLLQSSHLLIESIHVLLEVLS
jgi:hypothetical protein